LIGGRKKVKGKGTPARNDFLFLGSVRKVGGKRKGIWRGKSGGGKHCNSTIIGGAKKGKDEVGKSSCSGRREGSWCTDGGRMKGRLTVTRSLNAREGSTKTKGICLCSFLRQQRGRVSCARNGGDSKSCSAKGGWKPRGQKRGFSKGVDRGKGENFGDD